MYSHQLQFIPQQQQFSQPPVQYVIQMPPEEKKESTCCAGWSGFFLSLAFSPLAALFTLCCFKSDRARGSMFIWSSVATFLICALLFTFMVLLWNWAESSNVIDYNTGAGYYYYENNYYQLCTYGIVYTYLGQTCRSYYSQNPNFNYGYYQDYKATLNTTGDIVGGAGLLYGLFFLIYVITGFVCWCRKPKSNLKTVNPLMQPQILYSNQIMPQQQIQQVMLPQMSSANIQSVPVNTESYQANKIQRDEKEAGQLDAPAPAPLRKHKFLSLETLATDLGIDQLLSAKDVQEVLSMNYKELHAAYGVTASQYAKLKAYKESL